MHRIYIYDTTLRDGAQTKGIDFTLSDKIAIFESLVELGVDYIEAGFPGANPTDTDFFNNPPPNESSKITAFGMTAQVGRSVSNDPLLSSLIASKPQAFTLVGKSSSEQVKIALKSDPFEYLDTIKNSIAHCKKQIPEAIFDAEHFFDGFKNDQEYAMLSLQYAIEGGAEWIVLCDTNGGSMPYEVGEVVEKVKNRFPKTKIGIHAHNDTGLGVAVSMSAIDKGATMIQGTLNGLGERCGNANLITLLPNLNIKLPYNTGLSSERLHLLKVVSSSFNERLYRQSDPYAPYVGASAFSHKGGLHSSAIQKNPSFYEHINPEIVGNKRNVVVSDQAGRAALRSRLEELDIFINDDAISRLLEAIKKRENLGYSFDDSEASLELFIRDFLNIGKKYFALIRFRVIDDHRINFVGKNVVESEATVRLQADESEIHSVALGKGPVNALDNAMREGLTPYYPEIKKLHLKDYKVRIIPPPRYSVGTDAIVRVHITSASKDNGSWCTLGMSYNIIDASFQALSDSYNYFLFHSGTSVHKSSS